MATLASMRHSRDVFVDSEGDGMAQIEIENGAKIEIGELLKIYPREDVKELMVRFGIADGPLDAAFMIAIILGESEGDCIDLKRIPFIVRKLLDKGYSEDEVVRVLIRSWVQTEPQARRHLDLVLGRTRGDVDLDFEPPT